MRSTRGTVDSASEISVQPAACPCFDLLLPPNRTSHPLCTVALLPPSTVTGWSGLLSRSA